MTAPDFPTVYDLETAIEEAFGPALAGLITEFGLHATVVTSRNREFMDTPRVELYAAVGGVLSQRTTANQARPKEQPNAFDITLTAVVVTTRSIVAENSEEHGPLRGTVRYAFSAGWRAISDSNLPWHQLMDFLPAGSTPQLLDAKDNDKTELTYAGKIAVKNTAWPVQT